jgi:hypothetical protein
VSQGHPLLRSHLFILSVLLLYTKGVIWEPKQYMQSH